MNKVVRVKKSEVVTRYIPLQKEINKNKKQYKLCALISENQSKSFVPNILDAMLFSQQNDLACINGYSSSSPLYADAFWRFHNRKELLSWINLKKINVNDVFVYNVDKQKAIKITALDEYLTRIQNMVEYIKTQSVWMDDIKKRAIQRNITTDSCLVAEAVWQIEYNSKD